MREAKVQKCARWSGRGELARPERFAKARASVERRSFAAKVAIVGGLAFAVVLPATAGSYATTGPGPVAGPAGLPDGRVYEQVSPADKNGNLVRENPETHTLAFGLATEDGDAAMFVGTGAMGTSYSGLTEVFVSRRTPSGWSTSATRPLQPGEINISGGRPLTLVPSLDAARFLFTTLGAYVSAEPHDSELASSSNIFLSADPAVEPTWVAQPTSSDPIPALGHNPATRNYLVVGGTPDFGTVYFTYAGTLIPQDAARAPNVGTGTLQFGDITPDKEKDDPWGFYEWRHGVLSPAGVLPNGTLDPFGAVPAATAGKSNDQRGIALPYDLPQGLDNEISSDASRAFFVSPDPVASTVTDAGGCGEEPPCTSAPPELYVRETAPDGSKSTTLVSQSQLPGHQGEPAPSGPVSVENAWVANGGGHGGTTYVYASQDGSHAFFASTDSLAEGAEGATVKEYDFNVDTGKLTYLPGVVGPIIAASPDGSDFIFENTATTPDELDLWTGPGSGGQVTPITQLPPPGTELDVSGGRASADGGAFVFRTNAPLPSFNDAEGFQQVYRYSVSAAELTCISCPPAGVMPSGNAQVSHDDEESEEPLTTMDTRVMSSDGSRVFFDTPDPLVSQDTNGKSDVYEWENGRVYLISSGSSPENSFVLDSSVSGGDVFFTTVSGLVTGDADNALDAYDARIPRPGDRPPPPPTPCQGEACEGSPGTSSVLGAPPASATFSGAGNLAPPEVKPTAGRPPTRAQKLAKALKACRAMRNKRKRRKCEAHARKTDGPARRARKTTRRAR